MNRPDMSSQIEHMRIRGFRSLREVEVVLRPGASVLIGANGSGKSNIVRFFEMVSWMIAAGRLEEFVQRQGGADDQLFGGSKVSPLMEAELAIQTAVGRNDYCFALAYAHPDRLIFTGEKFRFSRNDLGTEARWHHLGSGHSEARISEENSKTARVVSHLLRRCAVYQFHDTSDDSRLKKRWEVEDNAYLRSHGGNLAAILLRLRREEPQRLELICDYIRRALPVFESFELEESYEKVMLRWNAAGMDKSIGAHLTSDGSLRFFALVTLLNLPSGMLPDVVLLDEPELGLHPAAVGLIGDMIKVCAEERQIVVATQSPLLVDAFDIAEILVVEMQTGETCIRQCTEEQYKEWLNDFTTGELWQKNVLGGRP